MRLQSASSRLRRFKVNGSTFRAQVLLFLVQSTAFVLRIIVITETRNILTGQEYVDKVQGACAGLKHATAFWQSEADVRRLCVGFC
jgi:hypothetical protein